MPAITITAINTGTEEFTAIAHGLLTGDRFRLRNVGGALPAATPALAAVTDYFAVRTGADTFKVSDTNAHALAGTNIVNLTGALTGTTIIEYGLPYCVPRIAAIGSQVFPEDDNAAWSSLVALHALLTSQPQSIWNGFSLARRRSANMVPLRNNNFAAWNGEYYQSSGSGTPGMDLQMPFEVGDRIVGFEFAAFGNGTADCTLTLSALTFDLAGGAPSFATITDNNRAAAWSIVTVLAGTPHTMAAGESLLLQIDPNASGYRVKNVAAIYDRPIP